MLFSAMLLMMLGFISWSVPGIAGGTIMALVMKWAEPRIEYARLLVIALGWIAGMVVGGMAGLLLNQSLYELKPWLGSFGYQVPLIISFAVTFFVSLATIQFLMRIVAHEKFYLFSWYNIILGILILLWWFFV